MRYLITGGAGFLGSNLARRLLDDGHQVNVLDDFSRGRADRVSGLRVLTFSGDVRDEKAVARAMHGCDAVIHMAYVNGTRFFYENPRLVLDIAVRGMLAVLGACESQGVRDLMLVSSSEVHQSGQVPTPEGVPLVVPDPLNPRYSYGGGKIASELMAVAWQRDGVLDRLIIARPHNAYGPDMGREHVIPEFCLRMNDLVTRYPAGVIPFPVQGSGMETRSFCHVDDCTAQLTLLLAKADPGAGVWHVGNMDERAIADVARAVAACYGRQVDVQPGKLPEGSPPRRLPDTAKIEGLGYRPLVTFTEGLRRTVEWYRANG